MEFENGKGKMKQHAEKMRALRQLAAHTAHDINNVLTSIVGFGDMIKERLNDPALERDMQELLEAAGRGVALCERLSNFARFNDVQRMPCRLEPLIRSAEMELMRMLGPRVTVTWALSEEPHTVDIDSQQMIRVTKILAANAAAAMPKGGEFTVASEVESLDDAAAADLGLAAGDYVRLSFQDTGPGIPADQLALLHQPFHSTREGDKFAGLGLSNALDAAILLGGNLRVDSGEAGTCVSIWIPVHDSPSEDSGPNGSGAAPRIPRVLIVDSELLVRKLAERILGSMSYHVGTASTPIEALNQCRVTQPPYDLALVDLNMRDDDIEAAMRDHAPGLRVLYMAGASGGPSPENIVSKPFKRSELVDKVQATLAEG